MIKTIGIVGPNFGGSTIFGSLMEGYSGVRHVGEVHRVVTTDNGFCRECGISCEVFTAETIKMLNEVNREDFYNAVCELTGSSSIVIGDKNPYYYERVTCVPDALIILLKDPFAHTYSFYKRMVKGNFGLNNDNALLIYQIKESSLKYYNLLLDRVLWAKKYVSTRNISVISLESFINMSDSERSTIGAEWFDDSKYMSTNVNKNMHYIGGNHKISVGGSGNDYFKGVIKADKRYFEAFSQEQIMEITSGLDDFKLLQSELKSLRKLTDIAWLDQPTDGNIVKKDKNSRE